MYHAKRSYLVRAIVISISLPVFYILGFSQTGKKSTYPFYVYNFGGLKDFAPAVQVRMLADMGYQGIAVQATSDDDELRLSQYLEISRKEVDFQVISAFVRYNFDDPVYEKNRWKRVADQLSSSQTALWLIFGPRTPSAGDREVDSVLKAVTHYAAKKKIRVVLYPHSKCYIESAEQALPFVMRNSSPRLSLAVHLCHEIRAGNGRRLNEVIDRVKPYIGAVTLSGTDSLADFRTAYAMDTSTVKPMDRGNFNISGFVSSVKRSGYRGPVGFINFKIKETPPGYLKRSIQKWNSLKTILIN